MPPADLVKWRVKPGEVRNPLGNNGGWNAIAIEIRKRSGNGLELVQFFFSVMRGEPMKLKRADGKMSRGRPVHPRTQDRIAAAQWLSDRGWGRAREIVELVGDQTSDELRREMLARLTDSDRDLLLTLLERAAGTAPAPALEAATVAGTDATPSADAQIATSSGETTG